MAIKSNPIVTNFTTGEISPRLQGRVDIVKYNNAVEQLENFHVLTHGGISKRSGTRHIAEIKTSTGSNSGAKLLPFVFSKTQAYILEFGHNYIRFYKDEGVIVSSGTTPYEISTTYTAAQVDDIRYTQSADILYLVHPDHVPRELSRTGHTSWTLSDMSFRDGPYKDINVSSTTMTPSGTTGSINVTASASTFVSTDVGRLIRIKHISGSDSTWGYASITGYTSGTVVAATVTNAFGATGASDDWRLGAFSATSGYPSVVEFYEERLFFANTADQPNSLFASISGDYNNFAPSGTDGVIADDNALLYTLATDQVNKINGLYAGRYLNVLTSDGPFNVSSGSATSALSPSSVLALRETTDGAKAIQPMGVSKATLYISRDGKKVREFAYNLDYDSYTTPDMTLLSEHIAYPSIIDIQYANHPDSILYAVRSDGELLGLTYYRDQDVVAWHRHIMGGSSGSCTVTVTDYINIEVGTKLTITKSDGTTVTFTSEAISGSAPSETLGFRPNESNDTTADNIYTAVNAHADFTVANPSANVVTITETQKTDTGPLTIASTDTTRLAVTSEAKALVKAIAIIPGINDAYDTLYMIVERTINGATKKYVEFLEEQFRTDDSHTSSTAFFIDSGLSLNGSSLVTSVSGLSHLEGQTVKILADGGVQTDKIVSSGAVTLDSSAKQIHVGLPYKAVMKTLKLEPGSDQGSAQGKIKRIDRIIFRLFESLDLKTGPNSSTIKDILLRTTTSPTGALTPQSGDFEIAFDGSYEREGQIYTSSSQPLPVTILSMLLSLTVYDR